MENLKPSRAIEADPTLYSRVLTQEERAELEMRAPTTEHGQLVTLANGTRLFRIDRVNEADLECVPETQHAVAMMLKGIVHVADVVTVESDGQKYHFSLGLNVDDIGRSESAYALGAQQVLLDTLFGDTDHHAVMINGDPTLDMHMNLRTNLPLDKFYFFDFGVAFEEAFLTGRTYSQPYIESRMKWVNQNKKSREEFLRLLQCVRDRFDGPAGSEFIHSVVKETGLPMRKLFAFDSLTKTEALLLHGGFERYFKDEILRRVKFMEDYLARTPVAEPNDGHDTLSQ